MTNLDKMRLAFGHRDFTTAEAARCAYGIVGEYTKNLANGLLHPMIKTGRVVKVEGERATWCFDVNRGREPVSEPAKAELFLWVERKKDKKRKKCECGR